MDAIRKPVNKLVEIMSIVIMAILVLLVTWQVAVRYLFSNPSAWTEQLSRYTFVWLVLVNAAYIFGKREHMNIGFIVGKFGPRMKLVCGVFTETVILLFALSVLAIGGISAVKLAASQTDAALGISMGFVYMAMPVSGVLTTFYAFCNIYDQIRDKVVGPKPVQEEEAELIDLNANGGF